MYGQSVMLVKLHQNGRATPAIRWAIQSSSLSASQLAARHGCSWLSMSFWPSFANASTQRSRVPDSTAVCAGMVERFNGRREEIPSANELATMIGHCAKLSDAGLRRPCQAIVHRWIPCGHGVKVRICLSKTSIIWRNLTHSFCGCWSKISVTLPGTLINYRYPRWLCISLCSMYSRKSVSAIVSIYVVIIMILFCDCFGDIVFS